MHLQQFYELMLTVTYSILHGWKTFNKLESGDILAQSQNVFCRHNHFLHVGLKSNKCSPRYISPEIKFLFDCYTLIKEVSILFSSITKRTSPRIQTPPIHTAFNEQLTLRLDLALSGTIYQFQAEPIELMDKDN